MHFFHHFTLEAFSVVLGVFIKLEQPLASIAFQFSIRKLQNRHNGTSNAVNMSDRNLHDISTMRA